MVIATAHQGPSAATPEWIDRVELQARRATDAVSQRLVFNAVPRRGTMELVLIVMSHDATPGTAQNWQTAIKCAVARLSPDYDITVFGAEGLDTALMICHEVRAASSTQSFSPQAATSVPRPNSTGQDVAQTTQSTVATGNNQTFAHYLVDRASPLSTVTGMFGRTWTATECVFVVAHDSYRTTVARSSGDITNIPRRIQAIVAEYELETRRLEDWLQRQLHHIIDIDYAPDLDSAQKFLSIAKYIMQPLKNGYVLGEPQKLSERIAELEQNINQREIVCHWYKDAARYYGFQGPDTTVSINTARHEHFIGVLKQVQAVLLTGRLT